MKRWMDRLRRLACLAVCGGLLLTALAGYGAGYRMETVECSEDYTFSESLELVGVDAESGDVIPLSDFSDGYLYAWVPEGTGVIIEKRAALPFSEYEEDFYQPYGMADLSRRGIIRGDESGAFHPDAFVSRAEFAAMLARVGRFQTAGTSLPYRDVSKSDWYYPALAALYETGIISPDEYFEPDHTVTREEAATMEWRMVSALGGKMDYPAGNSYVNWDQVQDFSLVQDWARPAYQGLNQASYMIPNDFEDGDGMDTADNQYFLRPQTELTREDTVQFLSGWIRDFIKTNRPCIPSELAAGYGLESEMPVIDGSTSTYPMTQSIYYSLFRNPVNHPQFPASHSKTTEAYKRLIRGEADLILVPDAGSEIKELAKQAGVELIETPVAAEGFVFFTGTENSIQGLRSEDIERIYVDNAVTNWKELGGPDASFAAYCRNNDSGSHAQMEKFFLKGREIHPDIKRERTSVMMSSILTEVQGYNRQHPGSFALGYSMYYYYQGAQMVQSIDRLKLLSIDGVEPTEETVQDGSYPLSIKYYAVIRAGEPEDSPARRLLRFLQSEYGAGCMESAGFGRLSE